VIGFPDIDARNIPIGLSGLLFCSWMLQTGVTGSFGTIEELRQALLIFREPYSTPWLIERHGFISPAKYRQQELQSVTGGVGFNILSQKPGSVCFQTLLGFREA
jgi:hypothetical protein